MHVRKCVYMTCSKCLLSSYMQLDNVNQDQITVHTSLILWRQCRTWLCSLKLQGVNALLIGQTDQPAKAMDVLITRQVAGHLFTDHPPKGAGMDLPALNTHRGRDHGIPGETLHYTTLNASWYVLGLDNNGIRSRIHDHIWFLSLKFAQNFLAWPALVCIS